VQALEHWRPRTGSRLPIDRGQGIPRRRGACAPPPPFWGLREEQPVAESERTSEMGCGGVYGDGEVAAGDELGRGLEVGQDGTVVVDVGEGGQGFGVWGDHEAMPLGLGGGEERCPQGQGGGAEAVLDVAGRAGVAEGDRQQGSGFAVSLSGLWVRTWPCGTVSGVVPWRAMRLMVLTQ